MRKDILVLWAKYNMIANKKMNESIKTLSREEWDKPLGGFFKSVRGLCSHLYICDFNWLKRLSNNRDFTVMKEPLFNRDPYPFSEVLFENMNDYLAMRPTLDEKISAFTEELQEEDINALVKYSDSHGNSYERNLGGLFMQSFNHDTHHRGMISLCLEMLGKENDFSSFGAAFK